VSRNRPAQISGKEDARLRVMNFMRLSIVGRSHVATPNDRFRGASLPNSTTAGGVAPVVPRTGTKRQISTTSGTGLSCFLRLCRHSPRAYAGPAIFSKQHRSLPEEADPYRPGSGSPHRKQQRRLNPELNRFVINAIDKRIGRVHTGFRSEASSLSHR
jgi:hypothetical protein